MQFRKQLATLLLTGVLIPGLQAEPNPAQLLSLGRMNEALAVLTNRNDPESLHLLSQAYYALEHYDEAVKYGERAVALQPGNAKYHLWLAREYGQKAAEANPLAAATLARKAKNQFERAVQLDPNNLQARSDLSEYYVEAPAIMGGGLDKARGQAEAVAKSDPALSHWILAHIAEHEKHYEEAEQQLKQALALASDKADYWLHLASFYRSRGRLDEMESAVHSAMEVPDKHPESYCDAASVLLRAGRNYPAAVQYLKLYLNSGRLVQDAPAFQAYYMLGQLYEKMGNTAGAIAEYQASLALASQFDRARTALSRLQ